MICSKQLVFRDVEEAVLNIIVTNAEVGLASPVMEYLPCGSLSEIFQTPQFKSAQDQARAENPEANAVFLSIYSDASSLNNSFKDSLHPVMLQVEFGRHLQASHFKDTAAIVGFIPSMSSCKLTRNGQRALWKNISEAERSTLTRQFLAKLQTYLLEKLKEVCSRLYRFPKGIGLVKFFVLQFKGDSPEKNAWANTKGCFACTNESVLASPVSFRSFETSGSKYEDGFDVAEYTAASANNNGHSIFYFPDLMVCFAAFHP